MTRDHFDALTARYRTLRLAIVGDFCLDRYLEIDATKQETSLETGLPVHNVINVRAQAGAAGTILNNLAALGIGIIYPIGFAGEDGEGYELVRALGKLPGVRLDLFIQTPERRTFTYCKPLIMDQSSPPIELSRLDSKNWTPTPSALRNSLAERLFKAAEMVDGIILLDQVSLPETGVVTTDLLEAVDRLLGAKRQPLIVADSRRGLASFPPVLFKMNAAELGSLMGRSGELSLAEIKSQADALARKNGQTVVVTLAERGLLAATATGELQHLPSLPLRGPIDIVGAGDAVTANLTAALGAGSGVQEALELANAAASVVIHKLGTTGTASLHEIGGLLGLG